MDNRQEAINALETAKARLTEDPPRLFLTLQAIEIALVLLTTEEA